MRPLVRSALLAASVSQLAALCLACSKPQPPAIAPVKVTVTGADVQALQLDVTLTATNPNGVDLTVHDVTAHVVLAQRVDLGSITAAKEYTLPAGKATTVDALLSVPWGDLPTLAQLGASPSVPFTVDGTVELGGELLHVTIPYHLTGILTQKQMVGATLKSLVPGLTLPR
jgi:LEA14-like dessication related protein